MEVRMREWSWRALLIKVMELHLLRRSAAMEEASFNGGISW